MLSSNESQTFQQNIHQKIKTLKMYGRVFNYQVEKHIPLYFSQLFTQQ
jgi:hypothetical protein